MPAAPPPAAKRRRKIPRPFQGLRHPYRLVFIDDDHRTELASFRLTKQSVWAAATLLFLISILLTALTLVFSPLKYYIPGYGSGKVRGEVLRLQQATDSLEDLLRQQDRQLQRFQTLIAGEGPAVPDTTPLAASEVRKAQVQGPLSIPSAGAVEAAARQKPVSSLPKPKP